MTAALERALTNNDLDGAMAAVPWDKMDMLNIGLTKDLKGVLDAAGKAAAKYMPKGIEINFNSTNPAALEYIRAHAAELVRLNIIGESQEAIRQIILRAFQEGIAPREAARMIKQYVGILPRHAEAVEKYHQLLLATFREQKLITAESEAARLAEQYAQKLIRWRATNIARTETINASNRGQEELWRQAISENILIESEWVRVWIVTPDDRLCDLCMAMEGATAPINGVFEGGGSGPPLHPSCRCAQGLQEIVKKKAA